jgi:calcium-translocating P-type ATPase
MSPDNMRNHLLSAENWPSIKSKVAKINEPQSREKNLEQLQQLGGVTGVAELLKTDISKGIKEVEATRRRDLFGCNSLPSSPRKTWFQLFVDSFDDETVQILIAAAIVSLAVGIYDDPTTGYIEGLAILAAVLVVSIVTASNDYQKETQFRALNKANEDVDIILIRNGEHVKVPVQDIVIGDLVCVDTGDSIPCDGVLVTSDSLEIDESALTGEPIDIEKDLVKDPFVLSGCIATAGTATFIATAVGRDSQWGVIKAHLEKEQDQTPLQEKLDHMAEQIGHIGMAAAAATMIAMMCIKIFVKPEYLAETSLFAHALDAFIIGVTIVVVAVPEGLPLAVTIALAYSTKKMLADKNLIRHLAACETMGNATNICSDKTGTLTENRMTVVKGIFANTEYDDTSPESKTVCSVSDVASEIILEGIATCSTARILPSKGDNTDFRPQVVGNKTEAALLLLAQSDFFANDDHSSRRESANFGKPDGSRRFPFSSLRKRMSVLVKKDGGSNWTLYHKGAGEIVLRDCTQYLAKDGSVKKMTASKRKELEQTISSYASQALRCVALAHRENIQQIVNPESATESECELKCEKELILDALVGIVDPLRGDVVDAVKTCQTAGIFVRMVTGDNLETANAIAKQAGILTEGNYFVYFLNIYPFINTLTRQYFIRWNFNDWRRLSKAHTRGA